MSSRAYQLNRRAAEISPTLQHLLTPPGQNRLNRIRRKDLTMRSPGSEVVLQHSGEHRYRLLIWEFGARRLIPLGAKAGRPPRCNSQPAPLVRVEASCADRGAGSIDNSASSFSSSSIFLSCKLPARPSAGGGSRHSFWFAQMICLVRSSA